MRVRFKERTNDELARSAIVFAPHQDDESLGCGGTIIRKIQAGATVKIVFVTDGTQSHARLISADELKAIRAKEAIAAAGVLGVQPSDVLFLAMADGQLSKNEAAGTELVAGILEREQPAEVYVPYHQDGPPDHEATTRIVRAALEQCGRDTVVYEYPVWFWHHWPWSSMSSTGLSKWVALKQAIKFTQRLKKDFRDGVNVNDVLPQKRAALEQHRSQVTQYLPDPRWTTLGQVSNGDFLSSLFQPTEYFYQYRISGKQG